MSYQTTPIITRIKYNQSWFQEYFPQTTLTYRRLISIFNKNNSYIKMFFKQKKFSLLKHEMIFDNKSTIITCFTVQLHKQKPYKTFILRVSFFVTKKMRKLFIMFIFTHVKQELRLCVNTKRILSSKKNWVHIGALKFKRFKKLKTIKNILRANTFFYKYNTLHVFSKYIKNFFQKKVKRQRIFFALFKTLIINTRPVGTIKYQLNIKGKVNSRPKSKKIINTHCSNTKRIMSNNKFMNWISFFTTEAHSKTGAYLLGFTTDRGREKAY